MSASTPPPNRTFRVRPARGEDAAAVLALERAIVEEDAGMVSLPEELTTTVAAERNALLRHATEPGWLALVAEEAGELVGYLTFRNGSRARIAHRGAFVMSVRADRRRRGVGSALLAALLAWADANPRIEKVCLAVLADNVPGIALYRKFGFREEGRRIREVKVADGRYVDDLLMYRFTREARPD